MLFHSVYASCPVCVITVGGGLLIAKKLGIDDLLVSIWISGLNTAMAFWIASTIKKKIVNDPYLPAEALAKAGLWSFGFYFLTIVYLWYSKQLVNKVFLGLTVGLVVFFLAMLTDKALRQKKNGKALFYYQKVVIPIVYLLVVTITFKLML
ncbi:MAG: hypothetical protein Q7U68_04725 [Candidatus Roizmanbacteria bacterium]|nr:hypothetical protein [Candidatus Roizmanbacteria bacterium]